LLITTIIIIIIITTLCGYNSVIMGLEV